MCGTSIGEFLVYLEALASQNLGFLTCTRKVRHVALDVLADRNTVGHVALEALVAQNIEVLVQPSPKRVFSDPEYAAAGAIITDDLSPASAILGVKQQPAESLLNDKSYVFFSHTIKAQAENMANAA